MDQSFARLQLRPEPEKLGFTISGCVNKSRGIGHDVNGCAWPDGFYAGYAYDAMNRVTTVSENGATSGVGVLATYAFDSLGRKTTISRGNGTSTSFGYDLADRLTSLAQAMPANTASNVTQGFVFSPASQLITRTWTNQAYSWLNHPAATTTSAYDGLNRDSSIAAVNPPACPTATPGANAGYDCDGNQLVDKAGVRHFTYDIENRLLTVTGQPTTAALAYDPLGRLEQYQTTTNGTATTTQFLYDGSRLAAEYNGSTLVSRYVHGPGVDDPLVWYQGSGTTSRNWLHMDRQGSVIAQSNAAGVVTQTYAYGPYGEPQAWGGSRFSYTGQIQLPEVALYHYKARAYDPSSGRFLQTDPVGYKDDNDLYAYVHDDPLNFTDPTGLCPDTCQYSTVDSAEFDAARDDRSATDAPKNRDQYGQKHEYGGAVYHNWNGSFSYNQQRVGLHGGDLHGPVLPKKVVAIHHSHTGARGYDGEHFSPDDKDQARDAGVPSILSTPSRQVLIFDPKTGKVTPLQNPQQRSGQHQQKEEHTCTRSRIPRSSPC